MAPWKSPLPSLLLQRKNLGDSGVEELAGGPRAGELGHEPSFARPTKDVPSKRSFLEGPTGQHLCLTAKCWVPRLQLLPSPYLPEGETVDLGQGQQVSLREDHFSPVTIVTISHFLLLTIAVTYRDPTMRGTL